MRTYLLSDLVITISHEDAALLRREAPAINALPVAFTAKTVLPQSLVAPRSARQRCHLLFCGNPHPIAVSGLTWLLHDVLPLLGAALRDRGVSCMPRLLLVGGRWNKTYLSTMMSEMSGGPLLPVSFLGNVPQDVLDKLYQNASIFVAPILHSTGVATKIVHAMAAGLPVLTTSCGVQGLMLPGTPVLPICAQPGASDHCDAASTTQFHAAVQRRNGVAPSTLHPSAAILVGDTTRDFASAAADALSSTMLWSILSASGNLHQRRWTLARQSTLLDRAVRTVLRLETSYERSCALVVKQCVLCLKGSTSSSVELGKLVDMLSRQKLKVHLLIIPCGCTAAGLSDEPRVPSNDHDCASSDPSSGEVRFERTSAFVYAGALGEQWEALRGANSLLSMVLVAPAMVGGCEDAARDAGGGEGRSWMIKVGQLAQSAKLPLAVMLSHDEVHRFVEMSARDWASGKAVQQGNLLSRAQLLVVSDEHAASRLQTVAHRREWLPSVHATQDSPHASSVASRSSSEPVSTESSGSREWQRLTERLLQIWWELQPSGVATSFEAGEEAFFAQLRPGRPRSLSRRSFNAMLSVPASLERNRQPPRRPRLHRAPS